MSEWKKGDFDRRSESVSKDWIIGILVTTVGALLALGINNLNGQLKRQEVVVNGHESRLVAVESKSDEVFRRLGTIDSKLDRILGWSKNSSQR